MLGFEICHLLVFPSSGRTNFSYETYVETLLLQQFPISLKRLSCKVCNHGRRKWRPSRLNRQISLLMNLIGWKNMFMISCGYHVLRRSGGIGWNGSETVMFHFYGVLSCAPRCARPCSATQTQWPSGEHFVRSARNSIWFHLFLSEMT